MRIVRISSILFLIVFSVNTYGQEVLLDLQSLPIKENQAKKSQAQLKSKSLLELPFFDDFSNGLSYPNPSNWSDQYVIVNTTYAINPPTIGVATFDAINQKGELYSFLSTTAHTSDTLTSQPINLNKLESDSLYFSFQYQPKGLGKEPQQGDSLVVEFLSIDNGEWIRVWSASANFASSTIKENHHLSKRIITQKATTINNMFFKVMLPITDEKFRKAGFRFRLINYASLPTNIQVPSIRGNGDQWHIDLVYLNWQRYLTDTLLTDVAFCKPIKSFLKNYESIPWTHLNAAAIRAEVTNPLYFNIQYRNLGNEETKDVTRKFEISNQSNTADSLKMSLGADSIHALTTVDAARDFEYPFTSNWADSAKFNFESYLITTIGESKKYLRWNDTIRYTQRFMNYYAYDDGSAENSYGIYGEGSKYGMVAIKYHSYLNDSLKAIKIYFNRTYKDLSRLYDPEMIQFNLKVWSDNNGKPGSVLYQKFGLVPTFRDSLNKFTQYSIDEKLKIEGDFWIGWENTSVDMLNVGFDLNTNHKDKLYYNLAGEWVNTQFEGSLMMRPVFGKLFENSTSAEKPTAPVDFSIYPNPASNQINLSFNDANKPEIVRIVNLAGQVVYNKIYENSYIDVGNLTTGVYLLQITFHNRIATNKKLVIIK
jgi:hypothetical protein